MYRIKDAQYGAIIEEGISFTWVKQQKRVDSPILAQSLEEADGVVLSDDNTILGIKKDREPGAPNMDNYTPLVVVEEISSDPYIMTELYNMKTQLNEVYQHQTEETVLRSELDAAYREGVNAVQ